MQSTVIGPLLIQFRSFYRWPLLTKSHGALRRPASAAARCAIADHAAAGADYGGSPNPPQHRLELDGAIVDAAAAPALLMRRIVRIPLALVSVGSPYFRCKRSCTWRVPGALLPNPRCSLRGFQDLQPARGSLWRAADRRTRSFDARSHCRMRVNMSAMGSVNIGLLLLSCHFIQCIRHTPRAASKTAHGVCRIRSLPASLADAGDVSRIRQVAEADATDPKLPQHGPRPAAEPAAPHQTCGKLRRPQGHRSFRFTCHAMLLRLFHAARNGMPIARSSSRDSSSLPLLVTMVTCIPWTLVNLSGFSSGKTNCSVSPRL